MERLHACQRDLKGEDVTLTTRAFIGGDPVDFLLVADGHGGKTASLLARANVLEWMIGRAHNDGSSASLEQAATWAIENAHREVVATGTTAGSTLTVVAINIAQSSITVASLGDSAALLVEAESETMLTEEHRLEDSSAERERVLATGSKLGRAIDDYGMPSGPLRAYPGGLAVCRTIGDTDCASASSTPYVHSRSFDAVAGAAVIVCSDGVWDAISREKVATYVRRSRTASAAATYVVEKAIKARGLRDDTSSVVAWLGIPPWDESRHESNRNRLGWDLGRKLSVAFGSRSSSATPDTSPNGSVYNGSVHGSPIHSPANIVRYLEDELGREREMALGISRVEELANGGAAGSDVSSSTDSASVIKVSLW